MGRDFKIGLMGGVVLGFVALIWVATRPSQSPEARMAGPSAASSLEGLPAEILPPSSTQAAGARAQDEPAGSLLADPADTEPAGTTPQRGDSLFTVEDRTTQAQPDPGPSERPSQEQTESTATPRFHIVRPRETLSAISMQYYGSPHRWRKIVEANRDILKDPNKISPGTKLTIPD
jgi:nucleoid-associated protein YgaU